VGFGCTESDELTALISEDGDSIADGLGGLWGDRFDRLPERFESEPFFMWQCRKILIHRSIAFSHNDPHPNSIAVQR
jgi:hypothetical protein